MITVVLVNKSTVVSTADLTKWADALQKQVSRDFAPIWGIDAKVIVGNEATPGWKLLVMDDADISGALGYHSLVNNIPIGKVFARLDLQNKLSVSVTISHELLELLLDPWANCLVQVGTSRFLANEACDPVEADKYGYLIDGVLVSDFITPNWFLNPSTGPWDFTKQLKGPQKLMPGGYVAIWTPKGWSNQQADAAPGVTSRALTQNRVAARIEGWSGKIEVQDEAI